MFEEVQEVLRKVVDSLRKMKDIIVDELKSGRSSFRIDQRIRMELGTSPFDNAEFAIRYAKLFC
jgi:hypothetical protein